MAMVRFGSLLVIVLLTVPMVRECCLPPAQVLPCHGTSQSADESCILNEQAIIQSNNSVPASCTAAFPFPITPVHSDSSYPSVCLASQFSLPHLFISDV